MQESEDAKLPLKLLLQLLHASDHLAAATPAAAAAAGDRSNRSSAGGSSTSATVHDEDSEEQQYDEADHAAYDRHSARPAAVEQDEVAAVSAAEIHLLVLLAVLGLEVRLPAAR